MGLTYNVLTLLLLCLHCLTSVDTDPVSVSCFYSTGQSCQCDESAMMNSTVTSLTSAMAALQADLDTLVTQFNATRDVISGALAGLGERSHVTSTLASAEMLLNNSQTEFEKIFGSMRAEMTHLRYQLKEQENKFKVCDARPIINETKIDAPFVTHYCGFETWDFCNYTQPPGLHADVWYRDTGRSQQHSGPREDHTFGTLHGYYVFFDHSKQPTHQQHILSNTDVTRPPWLVYFDLKGYYVFLDPLKRPTYVHHPIANADAANRTATLASPALPPGGHYCLRFWYTMYGSDVGTMTVYTRNASRFSHELTEVDHMSGPVDQYWHMAEYPLGYPQTSTPFNIVIKATTTSFKQSYLYNSRGVIALDDFYIYNTTCASVPKCPRGARQMTFGNQTSCYTFHVAPVTWFDAVLTCKTEAPNAHLVSVNSREEEQFLMAEMARAATSHPDTWYTSGNDEEIEGDFRWTDTGYPEPLTYTNWLPGQPDDFHVKQQCLAMLSVGNGNGYQWNDVSCDTPRPYICEMHV